MTAAFGITADLQAMASYAAGAGEIALGCCILLFPRYAWPQLTSGFITAALLVFVALYTPAYLLGAFNPVVMNIASIALSAIALLSMRTSQSETASRHSPEGEIT
jgi:hypothetical protein